MNYLCNVTLKSIPLKIDFIYFFFLKKEVQFTAFEMPLLIYHARPYLDFPVQLLIANY